MACALPPLDSYGSWVISKKFAHLKIMTAFRFMSLFTMSHVPPENAELNINHRKWTTAAKLVRFAKNTFCAQCTHILNSLATQQEAVYDSCNRPYTLVCSCCRIWADKKYGARYGGWWRRTIFQHRCFLVCCALAIHAYLLFIGHGRLFGTLPKRTDVIIRWDIAATWAPETTIIIDVLHGRILCRGARKKSIDIKVITHLADEFEALVVRNGTPYTEARRPCPTNNEMTKRVEIVSVYFWDFQLARICIKLLRPTPPPLPIPSSSRRDFGWSTPAGFY